MEGTNGYYSLLPENIVGLVTEINTFSMPHIWIVASLTARTQRSQMAMATAFLSLILIPSLSSAAIYKCTAQDGGIMYTDEPCAPDTKSQPIDLAATPPWLTELSPTLNTTRAVPDAKSQSQPEILAALCAADEFGVWLKAQHSFPEADARTAKFIRLSKLCRRALHLPDVAAPAPESPPKLVLASAAGSG
ncbi:MAG TPA: DUF4124 domain-containing protein [Steroidobacteraceae bacterium]